MQADAHRAAARGWHIFPCVPGGKEPALRGSWYLHATTAPLQIFRWWDDHPDYNIGISCKKSGLLVVDCDVSKGQVDALKGTAYEWIHDVYGSHIDGWDCFQAIVERVGGDWAEAIDTYRVQTTRMGVHLYYAWPGDVRASQASLVPGYLDVRTNGGKQGGYVLGAGSWTPDGPYLCEANRSIRDCPEWLVTLLRERRTANPQPVRRQDSWHFPGSGSVSGLLETVRSAQEGNRNNALHWAACCFRDDGESEDECRTALIGAARQAGLTEREVLATIRSAYRKEGRP